MSTSNIVHYSNPRELERDSPDAEAGRFYYDTRYGNLYLASKSHNLKLKSYEVEHPLLVNVKTGTIFSIAGGTFGSRPGDFIEVEQPFEIKPKYSE